MAIIQKHLNNEVAAGGEIVIDLPFPPDIYDQAAAMLCSISAEVSMYSGAYSLTWGEGSVVVKNTGSLWPKDSDIFLYLPDVINGDYIGIGDYMPLANRALYIKNAYPFVDRDGGSTRPFQGLQYLAIHVGGLDFTHASILGTFTVTYPGACGENRITVAAGKITVTAGDIWGRITINDGETVWGAYEVASALSATSGVFWDVSGNGRHLLFTVADTSVVCLSGREKGSEYLDLYGWSDSANLLKYSDNRSLWIQNVGGVIISSDSLVFPAASYLRQRVVSRAWPSATVELPVYGDTLFPLCEDYVDAVKVYRDAVNDTYYQVYIRARQLTNDTTIPRFVITLKYILNFALNLTLSRASGEQPTIPFQVERISLQEVDISKIPSCGTIVCLGDSNSTAYPAHLVGLLPTSTIINSGVGGDDISEMIARFETSVEAHSPDVILLMAGTNDIPYATVDQIKTSYSTLLALCTGVADEVIIGLIPPRGKSTGMSAEMDAKQAEINAWLQTLGHQVVDTFSHFLEPGTASDMRYSWTSDGLHPTYAEDQFSILFAQALGWEMPAYISTGGEEIEGLRPAYNTITDVKGYPLQYPGSAKQNITRLTGTSTTIDPAGTYILSDTNAWRVVTGWSAGTANFAFDANGIPISFTGQQLIDAGIGPRLYCGETWIAGYTVDQENPEQLSSWS